MNFPEKYVSFNKQDKLYSQIHIFCPIPWVGLMGLVDWHAQQAVHLKFESSPHSMLCPGGGGGV